MPEQSDGPTQDIMQLWREWLTQSERQFNAFFNDAMDTEAFARTVGGCMEMNAAVQGMVSEGMQRYLTFVNMPSRTDVISLGETLRTIESRLARIEEMLQIAAGAVDTGEYATTSRSEPARTRRPAAVPPAEENGAEHWAIPEELRR